MEKDITYANNKKRKAMNREMDNIKQEDRQFESNITFYKSILDLEEEVKKNEEYLNYMNEYFNHHANNMVSFLNKYSFIEDNKLSLKGKYASVIQEAHCLVLAELIEYTNMFNDFSSQDLVGLFSCFTNIKVSDDFKTYSSNNLTEKKALNNLLYHTQELLDNYNNAETSNNIDSGETYEFHYDIVNYVMEWCSCENENECKNVVYKLQQEKDVFLGEFVKAILKINNLVNEMVSICEQFGYVELQHKLCEIPNLTLKFVATNQSLYV